MFKRLAYTTFVLLGSVFIFIIVASFSLFNFNSNNDLEYSNEDPILLCGTKPRVFSEQGEMGETIFKINCAACHKLYKHATGPALLGVYDKEPREGFFFEFITNGDSLLKAREHYTIALKEKYQTDYVHKFPLSEEDYENLMAYLKGI